MSSFLDSTGLSRLVSKITDYFAKKDGTYPNMTVGNVVDDSITAAKVKDNETLPVNVSGSASQLAHVTSQNEASTWRQIAKLENSDANKVLSPGFVVAVRERVNASNYYTGTYIVSCTSKGSDCRILQGTRLANGYDMEFVVAVDSNSITLYAHSGSYSPYHVTALLGNPTTAIGNALGSKPAGTDVVKTFLLDTSGQVGSPSIPVYVKSDGSLEACNTSFVVNPGNLDLTTTPYSGYPVGYVLDVVNTGASMIYVTTGNGSSGVPVNGCRRFCKTESNKWTYVAQT